MVALNLGLDKKGKSNSYNKNGYELWRDYRKDTKKNYIMVPTEIMNYLPHIHTQAINLYLYYFFRAKNNTGISWPSVEKTATDLSVSNRSVNYWNDELENLGLIARINKNKSSKQTYLLPISNFYYLEKEETVASFLEKSNKKLDGELTNIFHFFQWRQDKDTKKYTEKLNMIYLVFKRTSVSKDGIKVNDVFKIVGIEPDDKDIKNLSIDVEPNEFKHDVYKINDCSLQLSSEIQPTSLAISTKLNLLSTTEKSMKEILKLLEALIEEYDDLDQLESVSSI